MSEADQSLRDAVALTTNLLHQQQHGESWNQSLGLAREIVERDGAEVLIAQAHLTVRLLHYISEVAAGAEAAGIPVEGIPGGTTPENLLQEFGRQVLGFPDDEE